MVIFVLGANRSEVQRGRKEAESRTNTETTKREAFFAAMCSSKTLVHYSLVNSIVD
jgi:hypothetical protein